MKALPVFFMLLFAITMACGGSSGSSPDDAVIGMFDALKAGNGERAVSYMSESAFEEMNAQLEMMRLDPEASAMQLAAAGIEIDATDIPDITVKDFAVATISSPMMTAVMQSAEVSIGEVTINGGLAEVEVITTIMDETETHMIDVVMEDGQWKITEFGMNM